MTDKTTADISEALGKPFPKAAIKKHKTKGFDYIEGHTIIHRLNTATDNCWDFQVKSLQFDPVGVDKNGQPITKVLAHVAINIEGLGRREHIGVQTVYVSGEDLVKGAITDALKKCATLFGTCLELYGSDYEAEAVESPVERPNAPQKATQPPATPTPINANGSGKAASEAAFKRIYAILADHGLEHRHLHAYAVAAGHESSKELTTDEMKKLADGLKEKTDIAVTYLKKLADDLELKQVTADLNVNVKSNAKGQK